MTYTRLELQSCQVSELSADQQKVVANYQLKHATPGREGTTLTLDVQVTQAFGKVTAKILDLEPEVKGGTQEEALDKLAEWMERAAVAIRQRGAPRPVVCDYPGKP